LGVQKPSSDVGDISQTEAPLTPGKIGDSSGSPEIVLPCASCLKNKSTRSSTGAVAVQEGAKKSLNNPGNLKVSTLTKSWGATNGFEASDGGWIAQFPTPQAGEIALENFLTLGCQDELVAFHAPAARTLGGFTQIDAGNRRSSMSKRSVGPWAVRWTPH